MKVGNSIQIKHACTGHRNSDFTIFGTKCKQQIVPMYTYTFITEKAFHFFLEFLNYCHHRNYEPGDCIINHELSLT